MGEVVVPAFGSFVHDRASSGRLIVQPRLGFSSPARMRAALQRVKAADATTVGTLTLDSYTRVNDDDSAQRALAGGLDLNGFPLVVHGAQITRSVLAGITDEQFPVQVRHGSAQPQRIVRTLLEAGIDATEGGPVSYCLPYSAVRLSRAVEAWSECCSMLAVGPDDARTGHLESFAGCMLGQLCPPSLLVALGILEGLFAREHGVSSMSLSFAQQTNPTQDLEGLLALRALAAEHLPDVDLHFVVYTFMGVFPRTVTGARALTRECVDLAVRGGAQRMIVKTVAESARIPTVQENVDALEYAATCARSAQFDQERSSPEDSEVYDEARTLVEAVLGLAPTVRGAILEAFRRGFLDVPYCLHADNAGRTRSFLEPDGRIRWLDTGGLPLARPARRESSVSSREFLEMLAFCQRLYDPTEDGILAGHA